MKSKRVLNALGYYLLLSAMTWKDLTKNIKRV